MAKAKKKTIADYKDDFVKAWPTKKAVHYSDEDRENGVMLHPDVAKRFETRGFVKIADEKPEDLDNENDTDTETEE